MKYPLAIFGIEKVYDDVGGQKPLVSLVYLVTVQPRTKGDG